MNEEMVNALNFGGGEIGNERDAENRKKTREERHAEIMEKSKAYKLHHQEIKEATMAYTKELDDEFKDHKFSVSGLQEFTSFQIKFVFTGTNSCLPARIKDLRGIALAV